VTTSSIEGLPTTGVWNVDPNHSLVTFGVIHHSVAIVRASFPEVTGSFNADIRRLIGEVPAENLVIPPLEPRRTHVLSADFLDAEHFPTLSFESTSLDRSGRALTVIGLLTIRGVTKEMVASGTFRDPVSFESLNGGVAHRFGMDLTTTIDRRDYGLTFNRDLGNGVLNLGWDVKIEATMDLVLAD
jgi:polyisoprenoid-binding protein YceI